MRKIIDRSAQQTVVSPMELPSKVLNALRLGVCATALFAPGCGAVADAMPSVADASETFAARPARAETGFHGLARSAESAHFRNARRSKLSGLGAEVAKAVARAQPRLAPPPTEVLIPALPEEDVTAVIPFRAGPSAPGSSSTPTVSLRIAPRLSRPTRPEFHETDEAQPCDPTRTLRLAR